MAHVLVAVVPVVVPVVVVLAFVQVVVVPVVGVPLCFGFLLSLFRCVSVSLVGWSVGAAKG